MTPNQIVYLSDFISIIGHITSIVPSFAIISAGRLLQGISTGINSSMVSIYVF